MRLLVSCIPYDGGRSGISVYVRETVRELAADGHKLTLLVEPGEEERIAADCGLSGPDAVEGVVAAPRWTRRAPLSMLWHLFFLPRWIRRRRNMFDGFFICAANRRVCASYPLPTAATVHDLANFHIPGKYSRLRMFYLGHVLPHYAKKAQRLVAVSEATKTDMVEFWHCREEDVTVLYNGLPGKSGESGNSGNSGKSGAAILYVSRIEHPGKNHVRLIEAYGRLPTETAAAHPLVIAGADWKDAEAVHEAAAKSTNASHIRFTGFADDLEPLWREAGFYVFPSLFEGFGLSLAEAMARGIPCACSENGSLGEIGGDAAVKFDPYDTGSIAAALETLLTENAEKREARIRRGLELVRRFSWADHARGIVSLLEEAGKDENRKVVRLFGIPVSKTGRADAVERIISVAKSRRSIPAPRRSPFFVATLNVDFAANAVDGFPFCGNGELWEYLKNADFVTADGMPIVVLSKLMRSALPGRVTGADMVPAICRRCAEEGLSVYVLGGSREAVDEAFSKMGLGKPAGHDDSFVRLDVPQPEIAERINAVRPDVLFVALGNPKQEIWMGRNAPELDAGVMIGVGGTFNFIAGRVKRAPSWMQKSGLEWIYRIIQEPGRLWRRYAYGLVKFSWISFLQLAGRYGK